MSEHVPKRIGFTVPDDETIVAWINAQDSIKTSLLVLIKWHLARCKGPVDVLEDVFSRMEDEVFLSSTREKARAKTDKPEKVSAVDKADRTDKSEKADKKLEKIEKVEPPEHAEHIETVSKSAPVVKTVVSSDDVLKDLSDGSDSLTDMSTLFGH